jgi:glycosyltransferase involved in cell wall biosynthesis
MLSIIIPTLNEKSSIRKSLDNLKKMERISYEVIISDGRSTDGTIEIVKEYTEKIVVYSGAERQTIAHGRNLGANMAEKKFLVFIDSDVIIPEPDEFFEKAIALFEVDDDLGGITVTLKVYPEAETRMDKIFSKMVNVTHHINNNITKTGSSSGEFQMIRHESFKKVGGFNSKLVTYEDNDIFERLAKIGKTKMAKHLTVYHSGRRAHKVGWPKLMSIWIVNAISFKLFKKAATKEWRPIR